MSTMDTINFIIIGIAYINMMHMMVGRRKDFTYWLHIVCFVFGWFVGNYMGSFVTGLVFAICFHLILTSGVFD